MLLSLFELSNPVVPNRGAAAHRGAVKRCQGCCQILNLLPFKFFYHQGGPNWYLSQIRGRQIFFNLAVGAVNQKRLKNTDPTQSNQLKEAYCLAIQRPYTQARRVFLIRCTATHKYVMDSYKVWRQTFKYPQKHVKTVLFHHFRIILHLRALLNLNNQIRQCLQLKKGRRTITTGLQDDKFQVMACVRKCAKQQLIHSLCFYPD